jgi:hypothetical protein
MVLQIQRVQVWSGEMPDAVGAAAGKLELLRQAGAELAYVGSYPHPTIRERAILFVAPVTGAEQMQAARSAGLGPALDLTMLHVRGAARPGLALDIMSQLAVAGLALRGLAVYAHRDHLDAYLTLDSATAALAIQVLASVEG